MSETRTVRCDHCNDTADRETSWHNKAVLTLPQDWIAICVNGLKSRNVINAGEVGSKELHACCRKHAVEILANLSKFLDVASDIGAGGEFVVQTIQVNGFITQPEKPR